MIHTYIRTRMHTFVLYLRMYIHPYIHTQTNAYMHSYIHKHMDTHTHTHACIHANIHTHTYTCMRCTWACMHEWCFGVRTSTYVQDKVFVYMYVQILPRCRPSWSNFLAQDTYFLLKLLLICRYICIHIRIYTCIHIIHICMLFFIYIYIYIYTYIHVYIYIYIYIYT
jgi:hypothetical protein